MKLRSKIDLKTVKTIDKTTQKQGIIFGIPLNSTSKVGVLEFVATRLKFKRKFLITTPNPEIVLLATEDKRLCKILQSSDLSLPDGIGLVAAIKYLGIPLSNTLIAKPFLALVQGLVVGLGIIFNHRWLENGISVVKGRLVFDLLIQNAVRLGWKVFLVRGERQEAKSAVKGLRQKYPNLLVETAKGPQLDMNGSTVIEIDRLIEKDLIDKINKFTPDILFVGFGAPKQEKWINKHMVELNIGGAMVVGGAFRFLAKESKLPPTLFKNIGLEWFWRMLTEPHRVKRIVNAVIVFPLRVFKCKLDQR